MDGLISTKSFRLRLISLILVVADHLLFHFTKAAFPIEQDLVEITGVSPFKRWIVFMEKRATTCLHDITPEGSKSLTSTLRCMTVKNKHSHCLYPYTRPDCVLIHTYPNILQVLCPWRIHIIVHQGFNLNITILRYVDTFEGPDMTNDITHLNIAGNTYTQLLYPFTFMSKSNSVEIKFPRFFLMYSRIEYDVTQKFNFANFHQIETNTVYFSWGYFLVMSFRINVEMRARVALNNTFCLSCKLIVYDGPTGNLPVIKQRKSNGSNRFHRIVASTFQVFVVLVEDIQQQDIGITYAPIFINTAVYDISRNDYIEISFDNQTYCHGYSLSVRLCVFTFRTSSSDTIRFFLKELQFTGKHSGSQSAAGVVVFNHFNGTVEKMLQLNSNLRSPKTSFEIIGTGSKMLVSVFAYSRLSSITLRFSMSTANCNTLLVGDKYTAYSGYITPVYEKWSVFQINQSPQSVMDHYECYKLQFMHTKMSSFKFNFFFPSGKPVLVSQRVIPLRREELWDWGCTAEYEGAIRQSHVLENVQTRNMYRHKEVTLMNSFVVKECWQYRHIQIQIVILPCRLPCRYFVKEKYCGTSFLKTNWLWGENENRTCDICEHDYIFCDRVRLKTDMFAPIQIKSEVCMYANLEINGPNGLMMILTFNRSDVILVAPVFKTKMYMYLQSSLCIVEIPTSAVTWAKLDYSQLATWRVAKTLHWDSALYRSVYQDSPVTWEAAASYCYQTGASLLTIHSQAEYQFVKKGFLLTHDVLPLYLGVKRQVMWLYTLPKYHGILELIDNLICWLHDW